MKSIFDKETGKKTWELDKWYEKTIYIIGYVLSILYVFSFAIGFTVGFLGI